MCDGNLAALREYEHEQYVYESKMLFAPECDFCGEHVTHGWIFDDWIVCDDEQCIITYMNDWLKDNPQNKHKFVTWVFDNIDLYDAGLVEDLRDAADNQGLIVTDKMVADCLYDYYYEYEEIMLDYFYHNAEEFTYDLWQEVL